MNIPRDSAAVLPHRAYLDALARTEFDSPEWHLLAAGQAALELFETWADCDCGAIPINALELRRVRARVSAVTETHPVRQCLTRLVDVIESTPRPRGSDALQAQSFDVGRLMAAYGKLLQYDAKWALAADVHETLISYAVCVEDEEQLLDSMLMVGFSRRMQGQFDAARAAYTVLGRAAGRVQNERLATHYHWQSELGFAKLAIDQGNLPAAAAMLDHLIAVARETHPDILARALTDRARVATVLGDHRLSLLSAYEALERTQDPTTRDRILVNLAANFTHMGLWDQARDGNLMVAASAQETDIRWLATFNLMELAYLDGREVVFEQYRRSVGTAELPPYLEAVYLETTAHGCRAFGRLEEATRAFQRMLDVGERHGLNEFIVRAEAALRDVSRAVSPVAGTHRSKVEAQPAEVAAIAHAITEMRVTAGVST